jgi:hypothetical protein
MSGIVNHSYLAKIKERFQNNLINYRSIAYYILNKLFI